MADSEHFRWAEMLVTSSGLPNEPKGEHAANLVLTMQRMDAVREALGKPVRITSGYRSPEVNAKIGGSATSDHCKGLAVDFVCASMDPKDICRIILDVDPGIEFDQLIAEYHNARWVHIGFGPRMRQQVLTFKGGKYLAGLV